MKHYIEFVDNVINRIKSSKSRIKITSRVKEYIKWIRKITKNTKEIDISQYDDNCYINTDNGKYVLYDEESSVEKNLGKYKSIFEFEGEGVSHEHTAINILFECLPFIKSCKKLTIHQDEGEYIILTKVLPDTNIIDLELDNLTGFDKNGLKKIKKLHLSEISQYERYDIINRGGYKTINEIDFLNNSIETLELQQDYEEFISEINRKFPNINVITF